MSFLQADFLPFRTSQDPWLNSDNFVSAETSTPGTSKEPRPLDLPTMDSVQDSVQVGGRLPLAQYSNLDPFAENPWSWANLQNGIPQSQDASYNFGQEQYGGNHENTGPMLQFQGSVIASSQGHRILPDRSNDIDKLTKRRSRSSQNVWGGRSQKRKRIAMKAPTYDYQEYLTAKTSTFDYRDGAICDEDCNSESGSAMTCCSSCPDDLPCEDPHCAIPCAESSCEQPICPEDCPLTSGTQVQQTQSQQASIPASERLSFLQQQNAEPWNPVRSRTSTSIKEVYHGNCIDPALPDADINSQYHPEPESSSPPTPPMAQNIATPYSPEAALQTPQFMGQAPQAPYANEASTVVGAGGMFNSPVGDWSTDSFSNAGQNSWMFNCPWDACNTSILDAQFWMQHLHQAHLDPQYTYGCPLQSNDCPTVLGANPLNHLQTQHGFDMNENNFSCPAPTCSPAETYNDPAMFHNHFDQAHAIPAQGFLLCRLDSCNGSFIDQNQLLSHIHESHQLPVPPPKIANNFMNQNETACYPLAIPDNEVLVAHTCKWKLRGGDVCGETCGSEKDLQDHVKAKHLAVLSKSTGYICQWEHCGRPAKMGAKQGFSQRGKLERHMASHTNCKPSQYVLRY